VKKFPQHLPVIVIVARKRSATVTVYHWFQNHLHVYSFSISLL